MTKKNIIEYINKCKKQGFSDDEIKKALLDAGWKEGDINSSLAKTTEDKQGFEPTKPARPKPKWLIPIIIIIGIVLIVGTVVAFNFDTIKGWLTKAEDQLEEDKEEILLDEEEILLDNEIIDCGSVDNTHIFIHPQDITDQEKDSLNCIDDALINCSLAKIDFVMGELPEGVPVIGEQTGGTYEILEKDNQKCLISERLGSDDSSSQKTCKVPMTFISDFKESVEQAGRSDYFFPAMSVVVFMLGGVTDEKTGEEIDFECE